MRSDQEREVDYVHEAEDRPAMRGLPDRARMAFGQSIAMLQWREPPENVPLWKPLHNFGPGVGELKRGDWRVVLSIEVDPKTIWIVCVFKKDSKSGSKMPKVHTEMIEARLKRLTRRLQSGPHIKH